MIHHKPSESMDQPICHPSLRCQGTLLKWKIYYNKRPEAIIRLSTPLVHVFCVKYVSILAPFELYRDCIYFGQWKEGIKHGYGKMYFPDGSNYSGQF